MEIQIEMDPKIKELRRGESQSMREEERKKKGEDIGANKGSTWSRFYTCQVPRADATSSTIISFPPDIFEANKPIFLNAFTSFIVICHQILLSCLKISSSI